MSKKVKVNFYIDARMINNSGIGVYIQKYIKYIIEDDMFKITLIGRKTELDRYFGKMLNWSHIEAKFPIYSISEQLRLPLLIPTCDIFWSPHYNVPLLPIRAHLRLVTIPDVYHLAYYETLSRAQKVYARVVANAAVQWANKVTTISYYSKTEIQRFTGVAADKVEVIHLGLDNELFRPIDDTINCQRVRVRYNLPNQYILFVGNVKPNKNLRRLVDGFAKLLTELPNLNLVITGRQEGFITGDPELFTRIQVDKALSDRIIFTGFVDTNDLPILYSLAKLFVFPSIYEGFGFPPLEAMACGCPVVASNVSSIPEICGKAAHYIDPFDPNDIARGLQIVATNSELRSQLVETGYWQCRRYNWEVSSKKFIQVVKDMMSSYHSW